MRLRTGITDKRFRPVKPTIWLSEYQQLFDSLITLELIKMSF
jgi:hypothetical protein